MRPLQPRAPRARRDFRPEPRGRARRPGDKEAATQPPPAEPGLGCGARPAVATGSGLLRGSSPPPARGAPRCATAAPRRAARARRRGAERRRNAERGDGGPQGSSTVRGEGPLSGGRHLAARPADAEGRRHGRRHAPPPQATPPGHETAGPLGPAIRNRQDAEPLPPKRAHWVLRSPATSQGGPKPPFASLARGSEPTRFLSPDSLARPRPH